MKSIFCHVQTPLSRNSSYILFISFCRCLSVLPVKTEPIINPETDLKSINRVHITRQPFRRGMKRIKRHWQTLASNAVIVQEDATWFGFRTHIKRKAHEIIAGFVNPYLFRLKAVSYQMFCVLWRLLHSSYLAPLERKSSIGSCSDLWWLW